MKYKLIAFLFLSSMVYADVGDMTYNNYSIYKHIWELHNEQKKDEALELCGKMIRDEKIPKLDRLYFLHTRRIMTYDIDQVRADGEAIRQLIVKNPELREEYYSMMN